MENEAAQVVIPHREPSLTKAALKYAAGLGADLDVRLRLIDVHVVPYGVPLDEPTVDPKYLTRKLRSLARESTLPISAEVVYARDWEQGLRRSLSPGSLVLMAIRRSWWRTSEKRLAARLRKLGHQVIWVEVPLLSRGGESRRGSGGWGGSGPKSILLTNTTS